MCSGGGPVEEVENEEGGSVGQELVERPPLVGSGPHRSRRDSVSDREHAPTLLRQVRFGRDFRCVGDLVDDFDDVAVRVEDS
ncbi:MAG: hypothetical protein QOH23_1004 [Gaiellaceae bacterium]|nr:hypothetical protein [Gaiellaceae bacterium]